MQKFHLCLSLHVKAFQAVIAWWEDIIDSEVIGCWQTPRKITPCFERTLVVIIVRVSSLSIIKMSNSSGKLLILSS
jgi:hypothetical protein